jgi:hypothetical protein
VSTGAGARDDRRKSLRLEVLLDFAGREWVSRMLNPRPLAMGASLPVSFDLSHAHLFDAASGVALAREES